LISKNSTFRFSAKKKKKKNLDSQKDSCKWMVLTVMFKTEREKTHHRMQTSTAAVENSMEAPQKVKNRTTLQSNNETTIYPKIQKH